jgi:hypothetical protein
VRVKIDPATLHLDREKAMLGVRDDEIRFPVDFLAETRKTVPWPRVEDVPIVIQDCFELLEYALLSAP